MKIIFKNTKLQFQVSTFEVADFVEGGEAGIWPQDSAINNPEYKDLILDSEDKILWGRYVDGTTTDIDLSGMTIEGVPVLKIVNALIDLIPSE